MRVELPELDGKYYATSMYVYTDDGYKVTLELTSMDDEPSEREDFLREHPEEICDGHYERAATYEVASLIQTLILTEMPCD